MLVVIATRGTYAPPPQTKPNDSYSMEFLLFNLFNYIIRVVFIFLSLEDFLQFYLTASTGIVPCILKFYINF
jgi:hypothetical protein